MTQGTGKRLSPQDMSEIKAMYLDKGMSSIGIAKAFQKSDVAIRKALHRMNVPLRGTSESHRGYKLHLELFKKPLSQEAKYWIGLFLADGCILMKDKTPRFSIDLVSPDGQVLFRLAEGLGAPKSKVRLRPRKNGYRPMLRFSLRSHDLATILGQYGIVPNKANIATPPTELIEDQDFWRGVIDGDGAVEYNKDGPTLSVSGTESTTQRFIEWARKICPFWNGISYPTGKMKKTHAVLLHAGAAYDVIKACYETADIAIDRKMKTAQYILLKYKDKKFRHLTKKETVFDDPSLPPYPLCSQKEADSEFRNLCNWTPNIFDGSHVCMRHYEPEVPIRYLLAPLPKTGRCSAFYHTKERWETHHWDKKSASSLWRSNERLRKRLISKCDGDGRCVRNKLALHAYIAANMRPSVAKSVYTLTKARKILDPCAGWGDRLAAALATHTVESYHGFDPNDNNQPGYMEQIKRYGDGKDAWVRPLPFETVEIPNIYDCVFTSPPYFDTEIYASGDKQSIRTFPAFSEWVEGFYKPLLIKSFASLISGGWCVMNVANVKKRSTMLPLIDLAIHVLGPPLHIDVIGLSNRKDSHTGERLGEPVLYWRKP